MKLRFIVLFVLIPRIKCGASAKNQKNQDQQKFAKNFPHKSGGKKLASLKQFFCLFDLLVNFFNANF